MRCDSDDPTVCPGFIDDPMMSALLCTDAGQAYKEFWPWKVELVLSIIA